MRRSGAALLVFGRHSRLSLPYTLTRKADSVKTLALALAAASLALTAALGASASAHTSDQPLAAGKHATLAIVIPSLRGSHIAHVAVPLVPRAAAPLQTGSTSVPGSTATPTPEPSATVSPYPDPVTLLTDALNLFPRFTSVQFEDIFNAVQTNVEQIKVDGKGVANCTPAVYAHVTGKDKILGTSQTKTVNFQFEQKKTTTWKKDLRTKGAHTWKKVKASAVVPYGLISIDNPLACPSSSTGGSGGSGGSNGTDTLKDPINLGPLTYNGYAVWHVRATEISTDSQGNTQEATLEFFITRDHFLPVGYKVTVNDPDHNITETFEQRMKAFGTKVTIPVIHAGATTP